jgi:hypothetical protein
MAIKSGKYFTEAKARRLVSPGLTDQQIRFYDEMIALDIRVDHPRYSALQSSAEIIAALGTPHVHWLAKHHVMRVIRNVEGFAQRHIGVRPRSDSDIDDVLDHNFSKFFWGRVFYRLDALDTYATDEPRVKPLMAEMRDLADWYQKTLGDVDTTVRRLGLSIKKGRIERHRRYQAAWQAMSDTLRGLLNDLLMLCNR